MWSKIVALGILHLVCGASSAHIEVINQWNFLDFTFPYDFQLVNSYRPENTIFTGLEVTENRIFLALPRLRAGVPATLSTIPRNVPLGSSPALEPYPSWSSHGVSTGDTQNCTGLVSVYRMRTDSCNRLWVLDSGIMTSLDNFTRICDPKLVIFDLHTDQVVRTVVFPREVLRPATLFTNIVIDETIQGACDRAFVYITDTAAPGIVVYDAARDSTWRVIHPSMFPDPDHSDTTIAGETFTLMDGVVGLTHSARLGTLYFQPLATDRIFSVQTSALTKGPPAEGEVLPVTLVGRKSSQGVGLALNSRDDTLYFSPLSETSVATWNPVTNRQSLMAYDPQKLQFPAELRWSESDDCLWILSTRFQKFFRRTVSPNEINLRILRIRTSPGISSARLSNSIYY